jgi:uncharacterized protein YecT (DUF1311 family)
MVAVAVIAGATAGAQAQSFNCHRAYFPDEKLICMSPELSTLDERLDRVFRQNMRLLSKPGRDALDREEERWVVARRHCGPDHHCIEGFYRSRIGELAERLGEARGEDRREPTSAAEERWRDVPPPERAAPEPPPAEPRREPPATTARVQPERSEHSTRREPAAAAPRNPAPPASGPRRPSENQAGAEALAPARQPAPAQGASNAKPAGATSGSSARAPRIEFADPAPAPMTPGR